MALIAEIEAQADDLAALRRRIHARPELGFEERLTADLVAERLSTWGIQIDRSFARTGVVGLVHGRDGGASKRMVGLRADMDALPIEEVNTFAHRSQHASTMHACGHDGHTAMLLGAARHLAATRDFDGTVVLIFQPAEEGRGGALAMVNEGLFERYPVEAVFGMHNWPGYRQGTLAVSPGPVMASANTFRIVVHGRGSHAALPHLGVDPMPVACQIVSALQSVITRNKRPLDSAVLSVTMIHGGEASNVVPETCTIEGTVRAFRVDVLDLIERRMRALAEHTCAAFEAGCTFEFERRAPPVVNHVREALFAADVMRSIVGDANVRVQEPSMPSEDFAYMLQARPGAYCFIGNGDGDHRAPGHGAGPCTLHNPSYDFNDALLPLGATYWVRLAQAWLGGTPGGPNGSAATGRTSAPAR